MNDEHRIFFVLLFCLLFSFSSFVSYNPPMIWIWKEVLLTLQQPDCLRGATLLIYLRDTKSLTYSEVGVYGMSTYN